MIDGEWQYLESRQTRQYDRHQDLSDENLFYRRTSVATQKDLD